VVVVGIFCCVFFCVFVGGVVSEFVYLVYDVVDEVFDVEVGVWCV